MKISTFSLVPLALSATFPHFIKYSFNSLEGRATSSRPGAETKSPAEETPSDHESNIDKPPPSFSDPDYRAAAKKVPKFTEKNGYKQGWYKYEGDTPPAKGHTGTFRKVNQDGSETIQNFYGDDMKHHASHVVYFRLCNPRAPRTFRPVNPDHKEKNRFKALFGLGRFDGLVKDEKPYASTYHEDLDTPTVMLVPDAESRIEANMQNTALNWAKDKNSRIEFIDNRSDATKDFKGAPIRGKNIDGYAAPKWKLESGNVYIRTSGKPKKQKVPDDVSIANKMLAKLSINAGEPSGSKKNPSGETSGEDGGNKEEGSNHQDNKNDQTSPPSQGGSSDQPRRSGRKTRHPNWFKSQRRNVLDKVENDQRNAENSDSSHNLKEEYRYYASSFKLAQSRTLELIFPPLKEMVAGSTAAIVYDAALSIIADLTLYPIAIQSTFFHGGHSFDQIEEAIQKALNTDKKLSAEKRKSKYDFTLAVNAVLIAKYERAWAAATKALDSEKGLKEDMRTIAGYLAMAKPDIIPKVYKEVQTEDLKEIEYFLPNEDGTFGGK